MGLSVVAGCGESRILAEDIYNILKFKYKIKDINLIMPKPSCDFSDNEKANKYKRKLCIEKFPDSEVRLEIGKEELKNLKKNVVFVKYLYEPKSEQSINDNIMEAVAFGEIMKNKKVSNLIYAMPYLPYVRAHSVDMYRKKGFYQTDTLRIFVRMMDLINVNRIITIDPHSDKIWKYCEECNIRWKTIDPFNSETYGIFKKYYEQHKDEYENLVIVVPDKGSLKRSTKFAYNIGKASKDIAILEKKRLSLYNVKIQFSKRSKFKEKDVKGKNFLIIDDMISSGGTVNKIAMFLKGKGAKKVEAWVSHPVAPDPKKVEKLKLDSVLVLDTILQKIKKLNYIRGSDYLLAHAISKSLK